MGKRVMVMSVGEEKERKTEAELDGQHRCTLIFENKSYIHNCILYEKSMAE